MIDETNELVKYLNVSGTGFKNWRVNVVNEQGRVVDHPHRLDGPCSIIIISPHINRRVWRTWVAPVVGQ